MLLFRRSEFGLSTHIGCFTAPVTAVLGDLTPSPDLVSYKHTYIQMDRNKINLKIYIFRR